MSVFVNIGAKLLPSLNSAAGAVEKRFATMTRNLKVRAAETKVAMREMNAAMSPLLGLAAAGGLAFSFEKVIGNSSHLVHELQMLRNAGRTTQELSAAMVEANKTITALPTTTLVDNLKVLNETTGAFGNFQHALENLTFNQRIGSMMQNALGDKAGSPGEMFNHIVRAMEMRGAAQDHVRYQREVGELYRAMIFTGGRVNPEEFFQFAQQSNPYIKGYSQRYMTRIAPSLIQEFGGDKAGTMHNTFAGTILGKAKNKISTQAWMALGLLDPKQVVYNKVGPVGWKPGAIKGTDLALSDPLKWSETVLIPALKAHGFKMDDQLSLAKALMPLFRDRNANRLANALVYDKDRARLHKDEGLINKVPGAEQAYNQTLRQDPLMAWQAVKASLTNLSSVLFGTGKGESPVAVAMVHIANGINSIAQVIERHPHLGQALGGLLGFGALAATLKLFGIALRWVFSPLKLVWSLLFSVGPRQIGLIGWLFRGLAKGVRFLGPMLLRGLAALAPVIVEGLTAAFALLSNPIGWAVILIGVAAGLIYYFRDDLARYWHIVKDWFVNAWQGIKDYVLSIDWSGIGMKIADSLTFGLASKIKPSTWGNIIKGATVGLATGGLPGAAVGAATGAALGAAGHRALGGAIRPGQWYRVNERGEEQFMSTRPGVIIPNGRRAVGAGAGGIHVGAININGAQDPQATAAAVRAELARLARQQDAYLND
jgi:hypothetical protein